jgi:hypothetical protein
MLKGSVTMSPGSSARFSPGLSLSLLTVTPWREWSEMVTV